MSEFVLPERLKSPVQIGVIAPSGFIRDQIQTELFKTHFTSLKHNTFLSSNLSSHYLYFSGTDPERLADIQSTTRNSEIKLVMAARGGYGLSRILADIDTSKIACSGQNWVGFSDFTFLNLALLAKENYVSFQGPMAATDFGKPDISSFTRDHFWSTMTKKSHTVEDIHSPHPYRNQILDGTIWGGCLSILASATGTPFMPEIRDGILFIEDIQEEPYRVERMLYQLYHAGILNRQKALLFGQFSQCEPTKTSAFPYTMDHVVQHLRHLLDIPVLTGFPFGHIADKITVPVGGQAQLSIRKNAFSIRFTDYNK
ncbi:MAG: LD-carboxypeptidase [Bacteroidetes bacterium]|nr:LD-carboxypeptidase [Bacteroidota bacterium]